MVQCVPALGPDTDYDIAMPEMMRASLGREDLLPALPAQVVIKGHSFFLVRNGERYQLLSTTCPHQGGTVQDAVSHFECPIHHWQFDRVTGRCINAPSRALTAHAVTIEAGTLWADLSLSEASAPPPGGRTAAGLTMTLHAHACLELARGGFTLLMDPWLDGPAFLGAWVPHPPPLVRGPELTPDALLLTHEHPDHFHEPTLRHFDRATPVYVPDFPNQRMQQRLGAMGFTDVRILRFGDPTVVRPGWTITTFEPDSYWNDALVLIDVDGFRLLNINDAGLNPRIARLVGPVDVIAVQFSAGASGYPWTWSHFTEAEKVSISERMCAGKLKLIREAAATYQAGRVLPFASHFALWHDDHLRHASLMKRNTLDDVKHIMTGSGVGVIDLRPGDRWDAGADAITKSTRVAEPFEREALAAAVPTDDSLSEPELTAYLLRLNDVPGVESCEDLTVRMTGRSAGPSRTLDIAFEVRGGRLSLLPAPPERANLTIGMPLSILTAVVRNDLSWDEAFIGYWCEFHRHPNVYHAGFWRLFQAPYFKKPPRLSAPAPSGEITSASIVAEVLEAHGPVADRVLRRHGLYCLGCQHGTSESIALAARQHGVDDRRLELLVRDLNGAVSMG